MTSRAIQQATTYTQTELIQFLYNALIGGSIVYLVAEVLGLVFGLEQFIPYNFGTNIVLYVTSFTALYFIFISTQKYVASKLGCKATYDPWIYGPIAGFGFSVMTYGFIPLLYLGTIKIRPIEEYRLGKENKSVNARELAFIGSSGIIATFLILIFILEPLYLLFQLDITQILVTSATALMFYSTIPLPKTNGANIILYSRILWVFLFLFTLITFIFVIIINPLFYLIAFLFALVLAGFAMKNI